MKPTTAREAIKKDRELIDRARARLSALAASASSAIDISSIAAAAQTLSSAGSIVDERERMLEEAPRRARMALAMGGLGGEVAANRKARR